MKALVLQRPGNFDYAEIAEPVRKKDHAIIRIKNIGICGTDLHAFEGTQPFFDYPRILGHELSGELVEIDGAPGFQTGDAVTFLPYLHCGKCIACRNGNTNCCVTLRVYGVHMDGGMVDYFSVPKTLLVQSQGLSMTELAMIEPLSIGAHGIRRAAVRAGEFVLIMGAGPIGLAAMEFARLAGAEVIMMDTNIYRLNFCKTRMGISHIIHAGEADIVQQLSDITHGEMPAVVIDASGNRKAINNGLNYLAHSGRYILIGLQKEELIFSHPEFHKREATLMSSRNATREDFDWVIQNIQKRIINPLSFITNRVKFKDASAGFPAWLDPSNQVIKVMVENEE
jgi:2-desacetyl-2-hydroxyethyl bacteriochlorophyllide A dehydrogenase